MQRFGSLEETPLPEALRQAALTDLTGSITLSAPGDGGRIWLDGGRIAFASTDAHPSLVAVLTATGACDEAAIAGLQASVDTPPAFRPDVTTEVVAVVQEITDSSLSRLLTRHEGSWHSKPSNRPPLGVISTREVEEVLTTVGLRGMVEATREIEERGRWRPVSSPDTGKVRLTAQEWELLAVMARAASPAELMQLTGWPIGRVRVCLSQLARRGLLRRAAPRGDLEPSAPLADASVPPAGHVTDAAALGSQPSRSVASPTDGHPPPQTPPEPEPQPVPSTCVDAPAAPATTVTTWSAHGARNDRASSLRRMIGAVRRL